MFVNVRRVGVAVAAVAAAALIAAGCGDSGDSDGGGSSDLAEKQELVVQIGDETEAGVFDPVKTSYLDTVNRNNALFAGLYRYNDDASELVPYLASGPVDISEDGLTYTVKLRDDANWSDGKPITAEDMVFGVQHALDPASQAYYAGFMLDIVGACEYNAGKDAKTKCEGKNNPTDGKPENIGVTAVDEHTVEFKLDRPVPWFDQLLTLQTFYPLRKDVVEKFGEKWTDPANIVTSGPFVLTEYEPKSQIVVERNDEFWANDDVKLDRIVFRMIGEPKTALREFERGRIDMAFTRTAIPTADIDRVKTEDYYVSRPSTETQYMYMNTRNKELADPKVRQALAIAIDRPSIVENITKRGDKPMNTATPTGIPGYDIFSEGSQDFIGADDAPDLDKAKSLLEEGGWNEASSLNIVFSSDSGNAPAIAEQIQSDLGKIGVKVNLQPTAGDVLSSVGYGVSPVDEKVDLLLQGWVADYPEGQNYYQLFTCANVEGGLNTANYCSEDYDKLYETALETVDQDARFDIYKQLEAKLTGPDGDMPIAPIYQPTNDTIVATYVKLDGKDYTIPTTGLMYWDDISITAAKEDN